MNTGGNRVGVASVAAATYAHTPPPKAQGAASSLPVGREGARMLFLGKEGPGHCRGSSWAFPYPPLASTYTLAWIWKVCLMGLRGKEGGMEKGRGRGAGRLSKHGNGDVAERRDVHPRKTVPLVCHPGTYLPHAANLTLFRSPNSFLPILRWETEAQKYKVACVSYGSRDQSLGYWCMSVISVQEQLREAGGLPPVGGQFGAYSGFQTSLNCRTRLCVKNKEMKKISRV